MPIVEKLKMIKEDKGITNTELEKLSNIPLATITRVFNGHTPNPSFETISRIAIALGVSLDEVVGLKEPDETPTPSRIENTLNAYAEVLKDKDDRIRFLMEEVNRERTEKHNITGAFILLIGFALLVLAIVIMKDHF